MHRGLLFGLSMGLSIFLASTIACAQDWPKQRAIHIVVRAVIDSGAKAD